MKKINFKQVSKIIRMGMKKYSPEILTGIGIAGMIGSVIISVRATPKALVLLEKEKKEKGKEKLTAFETVKVAGVCYIPSIAMSVVSITCLISGSAINLKRNTALAAACTFSEGALRDYQKKITEIFGEKKEQSVHDAIAQEKIKSNPVSQREVIITTKGDTLCYDAISGRYFRSDIERIKKAENTLNRRMRDENFITLNEFYDELDLGRIDIGDDIGWHIDRGYIDLNFSSQLAEDGTPCLVIRYIVSPEYYYHY